MSGPRPPAPDPVPPADRPAGPEVADWSYATRRLALVLLIVVAAGLAWISRAVIPLVLVAGIVAFLASPVIRRLERRSMGHTRAVVLVYLGVLLGGGVLMLLLVPPLIHEVERVVQGTARFLESGQLETERLLERYRTLRLGALSLNLSPAVDRALAAVRGAQLPTDLAALQQLVGPVQQLLTAASGLFLGAVGLFIKALLAFVISLYMALEAPSILSGFESFMDREQSAESRELLRRVAEAWTDFLRGQFILMLVIGVVVTAGCLILGLPGALALGLLAGLLEVLPNIGPIIATVPAVAVAFVAGSQHLNVSNAVFALLVLGFYVLVQQLENSLVVPRVIGKAVALPSVVIMIAVLIGAEVGGVLGALVAAPTAATLRELAAYTLDKIRGVDPYPELRWLAGSVEEAPAESE